MTIPTVFWLVPIASVTSLCMAWYFFRQMMKEEEGNERMIEIASHVRKGAMAYLKQQYKVVGAVFVVLAVLFAFMAYYLKIQNPWVPVAFLTGGFFSALAGESKYKSSGCSIEWRDTNKLLLLAIVDRRAKSNQPSLSCITFPLSET